MSPTASSHLNSIISKYTPSSDAFNAARAHRSGIEIRLDNWLGVSEMFETGSLKHGTGVKWYSDADFLVVLKGIRPTAASSTLTKVRDALVDKYPSTTIQVRRPAVVCKFANGDETVEVVPAYPADGGGYWISDPTSDGWMKTFPKHHNSYVAAVNSKHPGSVKGLVRLLKTWKYKRNVPVSSCYLEMRTAKYLDGEKYVDLIQDLYFTLKKLQDDQFAAMNDPTGLGSRFTAYSSSSNKQDALSKLDTAVGRALKAKNFAKDGYQALAIEQLDLLFNQ